MSGAKFLEFINDIFSRDVAQKNLLASLSNIECSSAFAFAEIGPVVKLLLAIK